MGWGGEYLHCTRSSWICISDLRHDYGCLFVYPMQKLELPAHIFPLACVSIKRMLVQNGRTCLSLELHFSGFWKSYHWVRRIKLPRMVQKPDMAIFSRFITTSVRTVQCVFLFAACICPYIPHTIRVRDTSLSTSVLHTFAWVLLWYDH